MKIGIIHGSFKTVGGSEKVAALLIKIFKKNGHVVELFFNNDVDNALVKKSFGNLLEEVKINKVFQFNIPIFRSYVDLLNRRFLTRAANKDDFVIETSGALIPGWFTNKPYTVYCNGVISSKQKKAKLTPWRRVYQYFYLKFYAKMSNQNKNVSIISNSRYTKELIKNKLGMDSTVIYPPVNTRNFKCNTSKKTKKVIMLGRFSPEKNYELAINLAEFLDAVEFIFVGNVGNVEYYKKIEGIIIEKNLEHRISLMPGLPMDELVEMLCSSKIYLHCRIDEPFGISVIEAIAAGCIPIVPDFNAHIETVPFEELRFSDSKEAIEIIKNALEGKYDYLLPKLQDHIEQFDEKSFENQINNYLKKYK